MTTKQKTTIALATSMVASLTLAESPVTASFNEKGYGTLSGQVQSVSMYRDYDNGVNAYSTSLGILLKYVSPEWSGLSVGAAYNGAGVLDSMDYGEDGITNPGEALVSNGRINLFNEAYLNYNFLNDSSATVGRKINNAEVFRADPIRQKSRSIAAIQAESKDVNNWRFAGGHSFEQSGILDTGERWEFRNYGDVFGKTNDTDGVTWGETSFSGIENLNIALFDACAWDVANMFGIRADYAVTKKTSLLGYYRNEVDVGRADDHDSNMAGISVVQKVGKVRIEGGYFGIYGDGLQFNQFTTGINHALGMSLMAYNGTWAGGADSYYLKATTKLENSNTILYTLAHYTKQSGNFMDKAGTVIDSAGELDLIVKQPIGKNLSVTGKGGLGYQDGPNTFASDVRLFITYKF